MENELNNTGLPSNAYKELKPGEEYFPVMPANKIFPEVTPWSVIWGLLMAIVFSAAAAFSGLKIGQVLEAAIPISIIAVGASNFAKKKNALGQNVIIQSIGASSGVIVAGAIFTIPALYILGLDVKFFHIFIASLLGGFLGILFLIPFRKYFVKDMHGKFPFPEAKATTEILISGERGGKQASVLVVSGLIGGIYDFACIYLEMFKEIFTSRVLPYGEHLAEKSKILLQMNVSSLIVGFGYLVGLKFSTIITVGSLFAWFVLIPLLNQVGDFTVGAGGINMFADLSPEQIFGDYVRHIGIGAIAMAGLIGIIKSSSVIGSAFKLAVSGIFGGSAEKSGDELRTQKDLKMTYVIFLILLTALAFLIFLLTGFDITFSQAIVAFLTVIIIAFLFTTVAANAIAIVGSNPVSGMTLMTLLLSSFILVSMGLTGTAGMTSALIIGGVVCTALSMAGGFITDLKVGYWLGSTPLKQQSYKFLGTAVSAATVGLVIFMLNSTFGFTSNDYLVNQDIFSKEEIEMVESGSASPELVKRYETEVADAKPLVAPQANAMVAVIEPIMADDGSGSSKVFLYVIGAFIAIFVNWLGISPLAFALGMYLPLHLNTPLIIGGLINHFVSKSSKDKKLAEARVGRGTLIASGFIAGAAIFGIIGALLMFFGAQLGLGIWEGGHSSTGAEWLALVAFVLLMVYFVWDTMRAKSE
jgi:putative OPT family oligopeptide transporter